MIYSTEQGDINSIGERPQKRLEKDFVNEVCEVVMEALDISYTEQRIVRSLLKNSISKKIDCLHKEDGLLQQYESFVLDKASKKLKEELNLSSEVNHNYVNQEKFADITDEIKNKYLKE